MTTPIESTDKHYNSDNTQKTIENYCRCTRWDLVSLSKFFIARWCSWRWVTLTYSWFLHLWIESTTILYSLRSNLHSLYLIYDHVDEIHVEVNDGYEWLYDDGCLIFHLFLVDKIFVWTILLIVDVLILQLIQL